MPRKKLIRYKELSNFKNVYDSFSNNSIRLFCNPNPVTLEIGCGRGEYTNRLAQLFPDKNFVGIDIKGERIWQAATKSKQLQLTNTAFIRGSVDLLEHYFKPHSVDVIWITHPDPQPNRIRQRLTNPKYLNKYYHILKPKGILNLKTDSSNLYTYSLQTLREYFEIKKATSNVYKSCYQKDNYGVITNFEQKALRKKITIKYIQAIKIDDIDLA